MRFWGKDRRLSKRYLVAWDAVLKATFAGFEEIMMVKVANFCLKGVLLHTERLSVHNQHLVVNREKPDLQLTIYTPSGEINSRVEIRWYTWSCEKNLFEVGVKFINLLDHNQPVVNQILNSREYETAMAV